MTVFRVTRLVARLNEDDPLQAHGQPFDVLCKGYASLFADVTRAYHGTDLKDWAIVMPTGELMPFDVISVQHDIPSPVALHDGAAA
jgi:hypothetical protein